MTNLFDNYDMKCYTYNNAHFLLQVALGDANVLTLKTYVTTSGAVWRPRLLSTTLGRNGKSFHWPRRQTCLRNLLCFLPSLITRLSRCKCNPSKLVCNATFLPDSNWFGPDAALAGNYYANSSFVTRKENGVQDSKKMEHAASWLTYEYTTYVLCKELCTNTASKKCKYYLFLYKYMRTCPQFGTECCHSWQEHKFKNLGLIRVENIFEW